MKTNLLQVTSNGLHCPQGGFFIDPARPVERALLTHAHADHARPGSRHTLSADPGRQLIEMRLGQESEHEFLPYGEARTVGGVRVSFHPAGHMLGSAQIRLEHRGQVAVVTGDYKLQSDPTCDDWEPVRCNHLVTESTFGLPIYRWPSPDQVFAEINSWWRQSAAAGKCCLLFGYAVGKAQRLLSGLDRSIGPIFTHGAVENGNAAYRRSGVSLPATTAVAEMPKRHDWRGSLVVAVPSAYGTSWMRRFGVTSTAMASGWMAVRGTRRRRAVDRGFVLSDHVDWNDLLSAVKQSAAEKVWVGHGQTAAVARYLTEAGCDATAMTLEQPGTEEDEAASHETET